MKIRIDVTRELLEKSKNCDFADGRNCAIALAVRDLLPNVLVATTEIIIDPDLTIGSPNIVIAKLPREASRFIERFDCYDPLTRMSMDPISFDVNLDIDKLDISIDEINKILSTSTTLSLVE